MGYVEAIPSATRRLDLLQVALLLPKRLMAILSQWKPLFMVRWVTSLVVLLLAKLLLVLRLALLQLQGASWITWTVLILLVHTN
jgi:hypothetical protein